jgi:hypothetical protein
MANIPEKEMIAQWWNGKKEAPLTALPAVSQVANGIKLSCNTKGASIGYRVTSEDNNKSSHIVTSWDYTAINAAVTKNKQIPSEPSWKVYHGETIKLNKGDTLEVNAMRIGYKASIFKYSDGKPVQVGSADTGAKFR